MKYAIRVCGLSFTSALQPGCIMLAVVPVQAAPSHAGQVPRKAARNTGRSYDAQSDQLKSIIPLAVSARSHGLTCEWLSPGLEMFAGLATRSRRGPGRGQLTATQSTKKNGEKKRLHWHTAHRVVCQWSRQYKRMNLNANDRLSESHDSDLVPGRRKKPVTHAHWQSTSPNPHKARRHKGYPHHREKKGKKERDSAECVVLPFPKYRWCNARAESQWIVRLADSHTYNTPLLNKVVYNLSISPDTRVVIQRAPGVTFTHTGSTAVLWFRDKVLFLLA